MKGHLAFFIYSLGIKTYCSQELPPWPCHTHSTSVSVGAVPAGSSFVSKCVHDTTHSVSQSINQSFLQLAQLLPLIILIIIGSSPTSWSVRATTLHGYIDPLVLIQSQRFPVVNTTSRITLV